MIFTLKIEEYKNNFQHNIFLKKYKNVTEIQKRIIHIDGDGESTVNYVTESICNNK